MISDLLHNYLLNNWGYMYSLENILYFGMFVICKYFICILQSHRIFDFIMSTSSGRKAVLHRIEGQKRTCT